MSFLPIFYNKILTKIITGMYWPILLLGEFFSQPPPFHMFKVGPVLPPPKSLPCPSFPKQSCADSTCVRNMTEQVY